MANKYKSGKFATAFSKADVENDPNKAQPALDDDYENELKGLNSVKEKLDQKLDKIDKELDKLRAHSDTGLEAQSACKNSIKKIRGVKSNLKSAINALSNAINVAEKEERKRMKEWIKRKMAEEPTSSNTEV